MEPQKGPPPVGKKPGEKPAGTGANKGSGAAGTPASSNTPKLRPLAALMTSEERAALEKKGKEDAGIRKMLAEKAATKSTEELTSDINLFPQSAVEAGPQPAELDVRGVGAPSEMEITLEPLEGETGPARIAAEIPPAKDFTSTDILDLTSETPPKKTRTSVISDEGAPLSEDLVGLADLERLTTGEEVAAAPIQKDEPTGPKVKFAESPGEQAKKLEAMARLQFGQNGNSNLHITAGFKPGIKGKTSSVFKLMLPADGFKMADLERKLGLPAKTVGECFPKQADIENKKAVREMWEIPDSLTFNNIRPLEKILALKKEEAEELNAAASDPHQRNKILRGLVKSRIIQYPDGPRFLCGLKPGTLQYDAKDGRPIMPKELFKSNSLISENTDITVLRYIPVTIPAHLRQETRKAANIGEPDTAIMYDPALRHVEHALFMAEHIQTEVIPPPPPGALARLSGRVGGLFSRFVGRGGNEPPARA